MAPDVASKRAKFDIGLLITGAMITTTTKAMASSGASGKKILPAIIGVLGLTIIILISKFSGYDSGTHRLLGSYSTIL